jgi:hypothetical protein
MLNREAIENRLTADAVRDVEGVEVRLLDIPTTAGGMFFATSIRPLLHGLLAAGKWRALWQERAKCWSCSGW